MAVAHVGHSYRSDTIWREYISFINSWPEESEKDKSLKLTDVGYHAYFGLSSHALGNDTEFAVKEDATKAQIKSAFKKSLNGKKMNKKVLSQFMEFIA